MKNKGFKVIFIIASVIMIIITVFFVAAGIRDIREATDNTTFRYNSESSYLYALSSEDYQNMYEMAVSDLASGVKLTVAEEELASLGLYFGAGIHKAMYENAGQTDKAAKQEALMEQYKTDAGEYAPHTDDIDKTIQEMITAK